MRHCDGVATVAQCVIIHCRIRIKTDKVLHDDWQPMQQQHWYHGDAGEDRVTEDIAHPDTGTDIQTYKDRITEDIAHTDTQTYIRTYKDRVTEDIAHMDTQTHTQHNPVTQ